MKEKEIKVDSKEQEIILYAEKDDDSIGPVLSGAYMIKNHLSDFYYIWGKLEKELIGKLLKKEISPIARFKELQELTTSELATRTGISKRQVKRHLTYKYFLKASVEELQKYADVFNIPVANFFQVISTSEDASWNIGYNAAEEKNKPLIITQDKTENPMVVITKPIKNKP
jgi:transcriptional regulator with XRE-family HTH domain